ncbi:hypothetical protein FRX31_027901 [Thalictrum thalictroides]|uniref:Uncharacterized protein n=1 Tax=Thalictrum thalictroides TaxID=46969 RepID=A0A7J6VCZ0_THATH|nr:hypothetical protein FRX31_027901 [Thalictrum thalictroides]
MNMSFVRIASLYGKYLLAPRLKNATKFVVGGLDIKGLDSLGAVMAPYAHQPVRNYCSSAGSAGVFEEWIYKNRSKDFSRLPMGLKCPQSKAAMEYAVKRHNLKMGTQLEIVDLGKRGNIRLALAPVQRLQVSLQYL